MVPKKNGGILDDFSSAPSLSPAEDSQGRRGCVLRRSLPQRASAPAALSAKVVLSGGLARQHRSDERTKVPHELGYTALTCTNAARLLDALEHHEAEF